MRAATLARASRAACARRSFSTTSPQGGERATLDALRDALEGAASVRASADAAFLECDPSSRPPAATFVARYAEFAVASLDAALARAGLGGSAATTATADAVAAAAHRLGGSTAATTAHLLLADAMLARDKLSAVIRNTPPPS